MLRTIVPCALVLCLGLPAGCRRPHERRPAGRANPPVKLADDRDFAADTTVQVWEIPLRHEIHLPRRSVSEREPAAVTRLRRQLAKHAVLRSRILLHDKRLVWELPELAMPGGGAEPLHLVIKPDANIAVLVNHKQKRFRADTPARIAAWIEGALQPVGTVDRVEVLGERAPQPDRRHLHGLVVLRGRGNAREPRPRYELHAESQPWASDVGKRARQLWDFLLLPVLQTTGEARIKALRKAGHWPVQLDIAPTHSPTGNDRAPRLRLRLLTESRRTRQVPAKLLRLPPKGYRREFGPLVYKQGRRLLHRPTRGLRPRHAGEPRTGPLRLHNPHRRALLVYADGLLVGWVGPRAESAWKVLPAGYYRLAAHSLFGTRLWGPQDTYLPGSLSFRRR